MGPYTPLRLGFHWIVQLHCYSSSFTTASCSNADLDQCHWVSAVSKYDIMMLQALSPAMDQWRKRISKIATSFELAHKAEISTAEKQLKTSKARLSQQEVSTG